MRMLFRIQALTLGSLFFGLGTGLVAEVSVKPIEASGAVVGRFLEMPPSETGLLFENKVTKKSVEENATLIPSGLSAGDVDGDGDCDLYFCSKDGENLLYLNQGDWKFLEVKGQDALGCLGQSSVGSCFADLDGDQDLDLLVLNRGSANRLFWNDGKGQFSEDKEFVGRAETLGSTSAAIADIDGDGDLDVYLCSYPATTYSDTGLHPSQNAELQAEILKINGGAEPSAGFLRRFYFDNNEWTEKGDPDLLLLNEGGGKFVLAPEETFDLGGPDALKPGAMEGWGLSAQFRDLNGDGAPELYVCNDFHTPDRLWINDGTGRFRLAPDTAVRKGSYFSMAVDFADVELDGDLDFFVADMLSTEHARRKQQMGSMVTDSPQSDPFGVMPQVMQNTFFLNRGDTTFAETSAYSGLRASDWTWGSIFQDVDLDGLPDLLISSGMIHDTLDADLGEKLRQEALGEEEIKTLRSSFPRLATRTMIFRNLGNGRFKEDGEALGLTREEVSGGMILADLDGDLDLDLVLSSTGAPPEVYRNDSTEPRIGIRLRGQGDNSRAIGSKVRLVSSNHTQMAEVIAGGRYASGCDTDLVFACPAGAGPFSVEIEWRSGRWSRLENVTPGQLLVIEETDSLVKKETPPAAIEPLLTDATPLLGGHHHRESEFDDFKTQPLLPNRMSRFGPGISWIDWDADGDDDLIVGGGAGQSVGFFRNDGEGRLELLQEQKHLVSGPVDFAAIVGYGTRESGGVLTAGISGLEGGSPTPAAQILFLSKDATPQAGPGIPNGGGITGPVAFADVDLDGDLDILHADRFIPHRYPEPASTHLVLNETAGKGEVVFDAKVLEKIGLVSGALFVDLDLDGDPDLVLAREWDAPAILENTGSSFVDASEKWGVASLKGWWNGVVTGDFDSDGRPDLALTNWGLNTKYEGSYTAKEPLRIYYGDLDGNGTFDIIEAHEHDGHLLPERGLSCSSHAMSFVRTLTPTFKAFGESTVPEIYGDRFSRAKEVSANELRHHVLLNRGGKFEALPLPMEAQMAPAFGIAVADLDGDSHEDLVLAQNFFAVQIETPRNDAGRGLVLLGNGDGTFRPLAGQESGLITYGEGRGCAVSDFNADGRPDIAMGQSNGPTRLWKNQSGRPALRVRLTGPTNNPHGFGAVVRAQAKGRAIGPVKTITGGGGYWSQDSSTVLLSTAPEGPAIDAISVRWPGGKEEIYPTDPKQASIELAPRP